MAESIELLLEDADQRPLTGWDVTLGGRISSRRPWDFTAIVATHAEHVASLLDLGTGGGEWLSQLPHRPPRTVATEGWAPNVSIARKRLNPLGIEVLAVEAAPPNIEQQVGMGSGHLTVADQSFDMVTSRHESYFPLEVSRVLVRSGCFLTQQVGSGASDEFYRLLGRRAPKIEDPWNLQCAVQQLKRAGFAVVDADEGFEEMIFADVGALAWYLKNMPFVLPNFTIEAARTQLTKLHVMGGSITIRQPPFWLKAQRA